MTLTTFYKKPKTYKNNKGYLTVHDKVATFFNYEHSPIATLLTPDIVFINSEGIKLKGYEPCGYDTLVKYQEWYVTFK